MYPFILALIVALPSDIPVIFPLLTFAILLSDEDHFTFKLLLPYCFTDTFFSCSVSMLSLDLLRTGAFTTLTLQVYVLPSFLHVILEFPAFFAVIIPSFVTDTTTLSDDLYFPLVSSSPSISTSSLSPLEITQSDTDSFVAACTCNGTDGTAIVANIAVVIATVVPLSKSFLILLPP